MKFSLPFLRRVALAALLAFLCVRLADAHLHVCLDGQEAPITVHTGDGSIHNDSHHQPGQEHQDRDVKVFDAIVLKKGGLDAQQFAIVAALVVIAFIAPRLANDFASFSVPPLRSIFLLRPPLRGPPL